MDTPSEVIFHHLKEFKPTSNLHTAILIDRDGVLIEERNYLKDPDQVELIPGSAEALRRLNDLGSFVAVVSNQAGVARGLLTVQDIEKVNARLVLLLSQQRAYLHALVVCPFHPDGVVTQYSKPSKFRKPDVGMYEFLRDFYGLSNAKLFMIGDKYTDVVFGKNIGAQTYLVRTGYGIHDWVKVQHDFNGVEVGANLQEVVRWITGSLK